MYRAKVLAKRIVLLLQQGFCRMVAGKLDNNGQCERSSFSSGQAEVWITKGSRASDRVLRRVNAEEAQGFLSDACVYYNHVWSETCNRLASDKPF